jgi:mRNA-degrading endonuclease RelE of RelBE toxin-antitoxin system
MKYKILLESFAEKQLSKMDGSVRVPILKKLNQMEKEIPARHLKKGLPYFVSEIGQHRIAFKMKENEKQIYFIGNHKEYEKWIADQ